MFDIFFGVVTNSDQVDWRLNKQAAEYSAFYNKMIHKLGSMYGDCKQPEFLETYMLMSETMSHRQRAMEGMRPDRNGLKYVRQMAIDKFNLMLAGEEKYSPRNTYSINSIIVEGFSEKTGNVFIDYAQMRIKWVDYTLETNYGAKHRPVNVKPWRAILRKGLVTPRPELWGIALYCRGETTYKRRERVK